LIDTFFFRFVTNPKIFISNPLKINPESPVEKDLLFWPAKDTKDTKYLNQA